MSSELSFGAWLKERRRQADLTQDTLAEQAGCSTDMVRKIEAGVARPSRQLAELLLTCLQVPSGEQPPLVRWARTDPFTSSSPHATSLPVRRGRTDQHDPTLPTGTVTFLFTDVEGSTKLWEHHPQAMQAAISLHDKLLRQTIESNGGYVFKTMGDGFCAAFPTAAQGVQAALAAQRALHAVPAEEWGEVGRLRLRMALHTGSAELRDGDYFGQPLNRVSRLLATGHGGQVLLSLATQQLVRDHLPPDADLRDLGEGGLRDLVRSEHVYQLVAPDLPRDFPPLKALDTQYIEAALLDGTQISNPYKGLRAFAEADAADFFGREALIQSLLSRMNEPAMTEPSRDPSDSGRFLAVVGPSGSGKSSVVRAGLVPALRQGMRTKEEREAGVPGSDRWLIAEMLPGNHPLEELEAVLLKLAANPPDSLLGQLREDERGLLRAIKRSLPEDKSVELLLVVDQFEELFTLVESEAERLHFLNSLHTAATDQFSRLRVIITLRADFYDRPLLYCSFGALVRQRTEAVLPLLPEELERAIVRPAARAGVTLEAELVAAIIQDVAEQPGTLPLLQYALTELFERRQGRLLTLGAYRTSGGVIGALGRRAEEIYSRLSAAEQEEARQLFLRLVTLGEETGAEDTRRRALRAEIASAAKDEEAMGNVLDLYGRYRMLTFDRDPVTGGPTVEVAHEALLSSWPRLRDWLDSSRERLIVHRRLLSSATEWHASGEESSFLASGVRLAQFAALRDEAKEGSERALALTREEQAYLAASLREQQRQEAAEQERQSRELSLQRRSANRLRALVAGLAVFLVIAAGLTIWAFNQSQVAQANFKHADALRLAGEANNLLLSHGDSTLAALLSIRSLNAEYSPQGDAALTGVAFQGAPPLVLTGHTNYVRLVKFSPDGKYLATGSDDSTARLWNLATGQTVRVFAGHTAAADGVAFSPDGKYLVTASDDATARLWDLSTGQTVRVFSGSHNGIWLPSFSPDGEYLLIDDGPTPHIWDIATGQMVLTFTGHTDDTFSAYSPDGKYVFTSSLDGSARLWDAATGKQLRIFSDQNGPGGGASAYSPDGRYVATGAGGSDRDAPSTEIRVWDASTGEQVQVITGVQGVAALAFSPDSRYILSGGGLIPQMWDVASGRLVRAFPGHTGEIRGVAFSPDGKRIASGSLDYTARVWALQPVQGALVLNGHTDEVWSAAFSSDAKYILTASADMTARIWDATTGREVQRFVGHGARVGSAVYSPDGKTVLTASVDNTARLWDVATGKEIRQFTGHTDQINRAYFSPDGKLMVSASHDMTARVWDVATGKEIRRFVHTDIVLKAVFSPDGKQILTGTGNGEVGLWDLATGNEVRRYTGHTGRVRGSFSPDGKRIVTAGDDGISIVFDVETGQELQRFMVQDAGMRVAEFSPDGSLVLTGGSDGVVRLWDVATGKEVRRLTGHSDDVRGVAFSPDGKSILTASLDKTVRVWYTDYHDTVRTLCGLLTRDLTPEERAQYGIQGSDATCPAH